MNGVSMRAYVNCTKEYIKTNETDLHKEYFYN